MDRLAVPPQIREFRRRLVVQIRLGGDYHRWGAFCALLVNRYLRRLTEEGRIHPFWARCVFYNSRRIADATSDDSDFDSDPEFTEYLAGRSSSSRRGPY